MQDGAVLMPQSSGVTAAFGRYDRSRDRSIESIGSVGSVLRSDRHETSGKRVSDDLQLSIFRRRKFFFGIFFAICFSGFRDFRPILEELGIF